MPETEFRPIVPFEDQSDSYVHGFEAGMIWQRMQQSEDVIETATPLHRANLPTLQKMAAACGYDVEERDVTMGPDGLISDEWVDMIFTLRPTRRYHLSVVT